MGLEFRADIRTAQTQSQTLSPRLQRAVQLLQMSSLDFAAMVRGKLGENPFLETEDDDEGIERDSELLNEASLSGSEDGGEAVLGEDWEPVLRDAGDDRDMWMHDGAAGHRPASDGEMSAMDMTPVETTLAMHLHGQLNVMPLSDRDLMLARAVVESLEDDGYLRTPLEEIAALVPDLQPPADENEMRVALKRVQALEPSGVGARGVGECLQLQAREIDDASVRELAMRILDSHLDALAARDVVGMAAALGEPVARIEETVDRIRRLDPHPGWQFGSSRVDYIVPDVVVRRHRGTWSVQLNPAVVPRVRLNRVYADLFQRHRGNGQDRSMGEQLQDARWTLRNVEQRFSTILDVAQAIVRRQRHFLEYGAMAMRPLVLKEIAQEVGVHESTVSRVTNNKYMATPLGVFELKHFFSRPMISASGNACSATAIRGLIQDIVQSEDAHNPLSDAEITRQLARQGLVIARRTATKYRQQLGLEPVDKRRRHA